MIYKFKNSPVCTKQIKGMAVKEKINQRVLQQTNKLREKKT